VPVALRQNRAKQNNIFEQLLVTESANTRCVLRRELMSAVRSWTTEGWGWWSGELCFTNTLQYY